MSDTVNSPEPAVDESAEERPRSNRARRLRSALLLGGAALAVVMFVAASKYQPLSIKPSMWTWKDRGSDRSDCQPQ